MNTTATDAAIEELEQLIEIEEAGYRLVMTWAVADSTAGGPKVQKMNSQINSSTPRNLPSRSDAKA